MPDLPKQDSHGEGPIQKPGAQPSIQSAAAAALVPNSQRRKHWAKQYRTEIAASSSSLLSTFAAVRPPGRQREGNMGLTGDSIPWIRSKRACKRTPPYLLLFVPRSLHLTRNSYRFKHFADCVRHTYKTEGFKGFWRGT